MVIPFFRCRGRTTVYPDGFGAQRNTHYRWHITAHPNGFGSQEAEGELPQILANLDFKERRGNGLECMRLAEAEMVWQLLKVISYPIQGEIRMVDPNLHLYD